MTRVFVYGSLLAGESNHRVLRGATMVGEARTAADYELYDLGEYPGMVAGGRRAIVGEVYEVDERTLGALDRFEGRLYRRTPITLADGSSAETYLVDRAQVDGCPLVASGSWRAR